MDKRTWHPGTLLQTSGSYWQACTLHAGVQLDIFSALAQGPASAEQLSAVLEMDQRGLTTLLNALAAMGLLIKKEALFNLTDAAGRFLVKSSPQYVGYMIMHHHHLVASWARLDEAVRNGTPVREAVSRGDNHARREAFLMGMYNNASLQAPDIVSQVSLDGYERLLDLGGGPGTYAIHFCQRNPQLRAVVYDLPTTRPFAEKTIHRHGLSDRITFAEGDYLNEDITGHYDVVWLSHILHAEGPEASETLIEKAVGVLKPGGLIIIHEFILNDSMDGPLFPALFALNMLQGTRSGQSYSDQQIRRMLFKAGIINIKRLDYCGPTESGIIKGNKRS